MKYTGYSVILDPITLETRIYLKPEGAGDDSGLEDYLALDPEHADTLSGALIMSNANRKRATVKEKGTKFAGKFRRK